MDLVGPDPEGLAPFQEKLGDPLPFVKRPVLAAVRKEILLADAEDARMEPGDRRVGKLEIGVSSPSDPDFPDSQANFDAHPVGNRDGEPCCFLCRDHSLPPGFSADGANRVPGGGESFFRLAADPEFSHHNR
jgi:hypothetical protein